MRQSRFSEERIIAVLKEAETGRPSREFCRKHGQRPETRLPRVPADSALLDPERTRARRACYACARTKLVLFTGVRNAVSKTHAVEPGREE